MKPSSAIIVHYRTPDLTVAAARSVVETSPQTEVIVVDNASKDGIVERLAREVPSARVETLPGNRGYGAGCNAGPGWRTDISCSS